jgi:hypothetical protein
MGWETRKIQVHLLLDAHGGDREIDDEGRYQDLVKEIRAVCDKYGQIQPEISADEADDWR